MLTNNNVMMMMMMMMMMMVVLVVLCHYILFILQCGNVSMLDDNCVVVQRIDSYPFNSFVLLLVRTCIQ